MKERLAALRARREAAGLTAEDVAAATRIPVGHVRALEEGRLHDLPRGPYAGVWVREIEAHLGVEDPGGAAPAPLDSLAPAGPPLSVARWAAGGSALVLVGLIAALLWSRSPGQDGTEGAAVDDAPDQTVVVVARHNTRLRATVDDEVVFERALAGGEKQTFSGRDRIELELRAAGDARIEYNGRTIVPQGRQDAPRRLVFVDDEGAR